jgi:hypothetical protein
MIAIIRPPANVDNHPVRITSWMRHECMTDGLTTCSRPSTHYTISWINSTTSSFCALGLIVLQRAEACTGQVVWL